MLTEGNYKGYHLDHTDDSASGSTDSYSGYNQYSTETFRQYNPYTLQKCEVLFHHHTMKSIGSARLFPSNS